jgi:large subunit ribosomal protein L24
MKNQEKNKADVGGRTRIRKGDEVIVMVPATEQKDDKGHWIARRVLAVYPRQNRILVEGVAVAKRSYRKGMNPNLPQGGIHDKGMPIHISNVMLADPKSGEPTRVGIRTQTDKNGNERRVRFGKASDTDFNN